MNRPAVTAAVLLVLSSTSALALMPKWKDVLGAVGIAPQGLNAAALSDSDITAGLKAALAQGTRAAVNNLGHTDGFWSNLAARIPLPSAISKFERSLRGVGLGASVDSFHLTLNRAAEQAVPVAAEVFAGAVQKLSLADVRSILGGPPDAATQYFRRTAGETLALKFRPLVAQSTARVGLTQSYKQLSASAGPFAAALGAPSDLDGYVTAKALDGLFLQVAAEEQRIRENPAARGSEILRKVFGAK